MEPAGKPVAERPCFLGIERSVAGKRWEERLADPRRGLALAQRLGLPEVVGRVLAARGVGLDDAAGFLAPMLREALPDPSCLKDMDAAVARLVVAVTEGQAIAVFGDYDVDGATSAALLARFLRAAGNVPRVYVPDRQSEGYGPNAAALSRLRADGADVVVTVDCGITAFEPLEAAARAGLDVIVVDHHAAEPRLPRAAAVVNPNRMDGEGARQGPHRLGQLAAVGVCFLLAVALNRALREAGWYDRSGRHEPDLLRLLDLVALGTVCDLVPLTGLNRALVAQGLKVMAQRGNPGLAALCDVARLDERPDTFHAGFILGPRVNAGGRVGEAGLGARLLSTDDPAEAAALARRLDAYNDERREIEAAVLEQATDQVEASEGGPEALVFAAGQGWHAGVVGIVASRLKDRYNLPALVVALDPGTGEGRGSGRSVPGVDLGAAVIAARQAGLLVNGGGHPMAAGLTVAAARLGALRAFLEARLRAALEAARYRPCLGFDGALQPLGATAELVRQLERCAPFGTGNAQPRFAVPAARVVRADVVGDGHVRCVLGGTDGGRIKGIAFRALDGALGAALLRTSGRPIHVAGKLRLDGWAGPEAVQLIIEDAAPAQR
ncbi:MAG: single-stranded-DNA-specific exonuclease RecJ [Kiloniellaceae bacterium]